MVHAESPAVLYYRKLLDCSHYNEEMMSFSFANCHIDCVRPEVIRAMYLVDGDAMIQIKLTT
jgi:hypothetical protein